MSAGFAIAPDRLWLWIGLGAIAIGALAIFLRRLDRRRARRLDTFVESRLAPRLVSGADARQRRPLYWLTVFGAALLVLALMQPHWGESYDVTHTRSHDVLVLLDVSESMLAESPAPNRLERAKQKIATLTDKAFGDRFGLIAFSGAAELMCPLTLDHGYFRTVLNAVTTDSISLEGTDIAAAFEVAQETFEDQDAESAGGDRNSRAVLLISDGEAVSGDAGATVEKLSKLAHVFVIGVGDPRGTTVTYKNRLARGDTGDETHVSRLDETALQQLALAGGGGYIRSTASNRDMDEIFGLINQLFAVGVEGEIQNRLVNRYQWPLAGAVACFFGEGIWLVLLPWLGRRRDRRAAALEGARYA